MTLHSVYDEIQEQ